MCVDALYDTNSKEHFTYLFVAPYEAQIRMIFGRINELIDLSPMLLENLDHRTKTPFEITFKNHSVIRGFTTGASSGGGATSVRGQKADAIAIDESDYLADADFDSVLAIAGERPDIKVFLSSTPTGARKRFWQCCTDRKMGYKEFYFPSTVNPQWSPKMEEEFRASLSPSGYEHEILAEFGSQDTGVFNKDRVDAAMLIDRYTYDDLTYSQKIIAKNNHWKIESYIPDRNHIGVYRPNVFRCMGVDWDKKAS